MEKKLVKWGQRAVWHWCEVTVVPCGGWSSVTFSYLPPVVNVIMQRGRTGSNHMANAAKTVSKMKLLYSEGDAETLASQAADIQKAGYQVETAPGRKAVLEALRQGSYDLVILGPTLSKNDRHHLAYMVKKASQTTRVLVMHTDGERHPAVDANLDTGCSMEAVLAKIAALSAPESAIARAAAAGK